MQPPILEFLRSRGFVTFQGPFDVNLIGVRARAREAGRFDDLIGAVYLDEGGAWIERWWPATTDPGAKILVEPTRKDGAPILVPGQYRATWRLGLHQGRESHPALVQVMPVPVWRDNDRDTVLEWNPADPGTPGLYGINIHAPSHEPMTKALALTDVGLWSAGCNVFSSTLHYRQFIEIVRESAKRYGDLFTYTLVEAPW